MRGRKPKRKPQPTEPRYRKVSGDRYLVDIESYIKTMEQSPKRIK